MSKLLLMGNSGVGKTSMHSIIFSNISPFETNQIGYTVGKNQLTIKLFGNVLINLWDCGGHSTFMNDYFNTHQQTIFKNVKLLVYVFDISQTQIQYQKSFSLWMKAVQSLSKYSQKSSMFVVFNKVDKVDPQQLHNIQLQRTNKIQKYLKEIKIQKYFIEVTTIKDFSLYGCWSKIVRFLIQKDYGNLLNKKIIQPIKLCNQNQDILILQKKSLLVLASSLIQSCSKKQDIENQLKKQDTFSLIVKNFLFGLRKTKFKMKELQIRSTGVTITMLHFSQYFYMLLIKSGKTIVSQNKINMFNVKLAQKYLKISIDSIQKQNKNFKKQMND